VDLERLILLVLACYALFWLAIGGAIGSFLNVVIYRLPRGLNLAHPPSSCPACGHPIRWRDNIPVLGWLLLRGRCRDCHYPIAARYPLVEATVALVFVILAFVELYSGGANLPFRQREPGGIQYLGLGSREMHLLTVLHCLLFVVLIALALIDQDGLPPPLELVLLPLGLFLVAALFYPGICPGNLVLGLGAGLLAGFVLGGLYDPATWSRVPAALGGLVLVGVFLGWQAALVALAGGVVVFAVLWLAVGSAVFRLPISPLTPAGLTAFGYVLAWKPIANWLAEPVGKIVTGTFAGLVLLGCLTLLAARPKGGQQS
jgi:leader peptidase (prepilin peptidase)/N-methyltransferase